MAFPFSHYFVYGGFFKTDGQLLDEVDKIRHIPCTIVQGRYDMACPAETAWNLYKVTHITFSCSMALSILWL